MPIKGIPQSVTSINGIEEIISMNARLEMDTITVDPTMADTALTVVTYYNPRYNLSVEGISSGVSVPDQFTTLGYTFRTDSVNYNEAAGDVKKVNVSATYYPHII